MNKTTRNRFAPAPTGLMHLGNVRTALMNYLFAKQNNGTFIIRVEDTDQQRNFDPGAKQILQDLAWLELHYDEGPHKGGPYAPYFQSERTTLYLQKLQDLIDKKLVYRCFCTAEELERKRQRQITLKLPPRYDRACWALMPEAVEQKLDQQTPFIWRLKIPHTGSVSINDLARGTVHFDFQHFSDHPLTRQDGSITFLFANFVDDLDMKITHIFRGEDHLTNTAIQTVLYAAFNAPLPVYWHMPILCNIEGKKLSKRDFGFSLNDLRNNGYLPEAICNYLAIIGGGTFEHEIMSMDELVTHVNFSHISSASQIKYDVEKLTWLNHAWIEKADPLRLAQLCRPLLAPEFPTINSLDDTVLAGLLQTVKSDLRTLQDAKQALHFYFKKPDITALFVDAIIPNKTSAAIAGIVAQHLPAIGNQEQFFKDIKAQAKQEQIQIKDLFAFLRLALMGQPEGPSIHDLITMLGVVEATQRIEHLCILMK
jgi:nondiscriminating glutamyl-tRNA synthetase